MIQKLITTLFTLMLILEMSAQMGIGTLTPDPRSILHLKNTEGKGRGLLVPRLPTLIRKKMAEGSDSLNALTAAQTGLLLYDNEQDLFYSYNNDSTYATNYGYEANNVSKDRSVWQILNPWKAQYAFDGFNQRVNLIQDTVASGYVGIGWVDYTESPTFPLHVKGDGYFEASNLTVDKTITTQKVDADFVGVEKKTKFFGYGITPIGGVMMWSGNWDNVVEKELNDQGWVLCDGRDIAGQVSGAVRGGNAPDLRGKFVVGFDPNDEDYEFVGTTGPEFGDSAGVDRNEFYEFADDKKRVKLLEPAMPRHDHGASNLVHNHEIEFNSYGKERVSGRERCGFNPGPLQLVSYNNSFDGILKLNIGDAADGSFSECPGPATATRLYNLTRFKPNGIVTKLTKNETLNLDIEGGFTWPVTSTKYNDPDETGMAIENRPPFYTIAYIMRVKYWLMVSD